MTCLFLCLIGLFYDVLRINYVCNQLSREFLQFRQGDRD